MNSIIEMVLELAGGVILLFTAGYSFSQLSGYGEHYDKMLYSHDSEIDAQLNDSDKRLYDDERYTDFTIKNNNDEQYNHLFAV